MLLKVTFSAEQQSFSNIHDASGLFAGCKNLVSVKGMETKFKFIRDVSSLFSSCVNLQTCDFKLPSCIDSHNGYHEVFLDCSNLQGNVSDFLP